MRAQGLSSGSDVVSLVCIFIQKLGSVAEHRFCDFVMRFVVSVVRGNSCGSWSTCLFGPSHTEFEFGHDLAGVGVGVVSANTF